MPEGAFGVASVTTRIRDHRPVTARAAWSIALRPSLWVIAVVQAFRLARRGWWRRVPFLPLMDPDYLRFRLETAYGNERDRIDPEDLIAYLHWCKGMDGVRG